MKQLDFREAWQSLTTGYNRVLKQLDNVASGVDKRSPVRAVLRGRPLA